MKSVGVSSVASQAKAITSVLNTVSMAPSTMSSKQIS
ncbi:unnamed protein product, partial [Vitis vinifera]|uniref:Uncharacterized protein n=1 Tax=Vitis vinifera TaxID=29760 RepID=D7TN96_VITVI